MGKPNLEDLKLELKNQNEALAMLWAAIESGDGVAVSADFFDVFDAACTVTSKPTFNLSAALRA